MLLGLFGKGQKSPAPDRAEARRVKDLAASALGRPDIEVTVSEIVCLDPSCPGTETVVLIMAPGARTRAAKVGKPAASVTESDLRIALAAAGCEVGG